MWRYGAFRTAALLAAHEVPVFVYVLSHQGEHSLTQFFGFPEPLGVCHGDDLFYLFSPLYGTEYSLTAADMAVREVMLAAWTSFVKVSTINI